MTARIVLTATDGNSMTPAIDILRYEFPDIYQELVDKISAEEKPTTFGGTGAVDLVRVWFEIDAPVAIMKQLDPFFKLLLAILEKYTDQKIRAKVVFEEDGNIVEWSLNEEE